MTRSVYAVSVAIVAIAVTVLYVVGSNLTQKPAPYETSNAENLIEQPGTPTSEHGFYDVDFAQKMIIQNQQGILMAELASSQASSQALIEYAEEARSHQAGITSGYSKLLDSWKEKYLSLSDFQEMDGHDMYPTQPGMARAIDIAKLRTLLDSNFDELYIDLMLNYHKGSIEMAESRSGQKVTNIDARALLTEGVKQHQKDMSVLKEINNRKEKK